MATSSSYIYTVETILVINNDEDIKLPQESITSIVINRNYDNLNAPIIYLGLKIKYTTYDKMVSNKDNSKIILTIRKKDNESINSLAKNYIHDEFIYFVPTEWDHHKPTNVLNDFSDENEDVYEECNIALMKLDTIDKNKVLYNAIIKNSNMISIVHKFTNHMNMVIEPFIYNDKKNVVIIPPIDSITKLLSFLNTFSVFYDKGYRYFRDFNMTYLLSNSGSPVDDGDDIYSTMILNIQDYTDKNEPIGLDIDTDRKIYIMNIDTSYTDIDISLIKNKEYNTIMGISSTGDIKKISLETDEENPKEKVYLQRVYNDNMDYIGTIKNEIDSSSILLQVTRTDMDSSVITPNKEYQIKHREYPEYNGRFILSSKKEILIQQNNQFNSETVMVFRKVID